MPGRGNEAELLGRGVEEPAQDLRVGRSGRRDAPLPPADQVASDAELSLADLDADADEASGHVLLGPASELTLRAQALVFHNSHPQDRELLAILLTSPTGLKAMAPRTH